MRYLIAGAEPLRRFFGFWIIPAFAKFVEAPAPGEPQRTARNMH